MACLFPQVTSAVALMTGVVMVLFLGNPYPVKKYVHRFLGLSVAGLGAGMNLETVAKVGVQGFGITLLSIISILGIGFLLIKIWRVNTEVGLLISIGTAICGGSAIAAVTPLLRAKNHSVSVSLGIVFLLNALALVLFPPIGHWLEMSEASFGAWSALAIHDTSSVVGATMAYGAKACEIGTTIKLARAIWIVPLTLLLGAFYRAPKDLEGGATKKPWFILWFVVAAALVTWVPSLQPLGHWVEFIAKRLLVLTLFLIGLGLSKENLAAVGTRPLGFGILLWLLTALLSLFFVQSGFVQV